MGESETVMNNKPPEGVTQEEAKEAAADIGIESARVQFESRFTADQFLYLYEYGRSKLTARYHPLWRETFGIGLSTGGLFAGIGVINGIAIHDDPGMLAVFWRTDSPNVKLDYRIPDYDPAGSYVYVCWLWNEMGLQGTRALRDHLRRTQIGAKRLAHHDQRKGTKRRNRLIDVPLYSKSQELELDRLLAERNGHGA